MDGQKRANRAGCYGSEVLKCSLLQGHHNSDVIFTPRVTNLTDLQGGHMWQEIIANKETHEDEIIHNTFEINLEWRVRNCHLMLQILPKSPDVEKLQVK